MSLTCFYAYLPCTQWVRQWQTISLLNLLKNLFIGVLAISLVTVIEDPINLRIENELTSIAFYSSTLFQTLRATTLRALATRCMKWQNIPKIKKGCKIDRAWWPAYFAIYDVCFFHGYIGVHAVTWGQLGSKGTQ